MVVISKRSALPGRLRLEIPVLKKNKELAAVLETELKWHSHIRQVQANPVTGRLLILYDPDCPASLIEELVRAICLGKPAVETATATQIDLPLIQGRDLPIAEVAAALSSEAELPVSGHDRSPPKNKQPAMDLGYEALLWHTLPKTKLLNLLGSDANYGLAAEEAQKRLCLVGSNKLADSAKPSLLSLFFAQFKEPLVKILLGAAGISVLMGRIADALTTLSIVVVNAIIEVVQEMKAEKSLESLLKLTAPTAKILRSGNELEIPAEELVPGDIILLEAGDKIPADCRILEAYALEVEEASLTGESCAVKKSAKALRTVEVNLADKVNMLYMGTVVTRGRAKAIVIATGMSTEMGRIAGLIQKTKEEETPLQKRLEELAGKVVKGCLAISVGLIALGLLRGMGLVNMLMTGITLAVAAIPEGLSAFVLIAMALGMQRMLKKHIIVRKMNSLETLGCTTVICSDKTGTLTKNEMTVRALYTCDGEWKVTGEGFAPAGEILPLNEGAKFAGLPASLLTISAACNNALLVDEKQGTTVTWRIKGDPTEAALLAAAAKGGIWRSLTEQELSRISEIPFEAEKRRMSTICLDQDRKVVLTKGALDEVLRLCTHALHDGQIVELDLHGRTQIVDAAAKMTQKALRVLAFAYRYVSEDEEMADEKLNQNLIFAGLAGMLDPPRPEAKEAIRRCHGAGVKVIMITGDHPMTAKVLAAELGIFSPGDQLLTGLELEQMSDSQLAKIIDQVKVFARTSPQQKLRIVKALKKQGHIVAMTGDGVNDAPAVKEADIGIAMGKTGTAVTKEASSLILTDDNFATIAAAMEEGRNIYVNIRKSVRYLLAHNVGEVTMMFLSVLFGLPLPLLPIQLLWMNLLSDGLPALALAADPPAKDIMRKNPRSKEESFFAHNLGKKILTRGILIGLSSLGVFYWGLSTGNLVLARTLALSTLIVSQIMHVFDCRGEEMSNPGLFKNRFLLWGAGSSALLLLAAIYTRTLQRLLNLQALTTGNWLVIFGINAGAALLDKVLCKFYSIMPRSASAAAN